MDRINGWTKGMKSMDSQNTMDKTYREMDLAAEDGYSLRLRIYEGKERKAVIQCIHGMEEHQGRYEEFASYLAKAGYVVVTSDLRGHGPTAAKVQNKKTDMIHIADRDGDQLLVSDEAVIRNWIKETYSECRLILFGHSMGSIIARKILQTDSMAYDKVILSGYPNPQGLSIMAIVLSSLLRGIRGGKGQSNLLTSLAVGPFCKAIPNAQTPLDWLSVDRENIKRYIEDPECGLEFTIGSYNALFHLVWDINHPKKYRQVKEVLPILLICGEEDPCPGGEKGRAHSLNCLKKAGFKELTIKLCPGMRHEILQEDKKEQIYKEISKFLAQS